LSPSRMSEGRRPDLGRSRPRPRIPERELSLLTIARTAALSSAAGPATGFLRNVLIARLIGVDDFAVSVVIAALAAAADILGDLGWEKYLVTHHDNDDDSLNAVHFAKLVTGGATALLLVLASPLIAHLTGRPDA